jgi:hypothetical protein
VLTQQQQEPITESAQENNKMITLIMIIGQIIVHTHIETAAATNTTTN